jgi:hypothetical protein
VTVSSLATYTGSVNTGWHHLAAVLDAGTLYFFIDGALQGSAAFSGSVPNQSYQLCVGAMDGAAGWNGWIDEFRLSVGIARWTADFTAPSSAYASDGSDGDILDESYDADDAEFDPNYGMLVVPLSAPVSGQYVRIDITDADADYVEAGRLFIGLREAFDYNFAPGAGVTWTDRSRKTISAGGQTLIFPDNKVRSVELNFEWVARVQRRGLLETIDRVNGQSIDVLLILDTDSDNLPMDTIFGLISAPAANLYTSIPDIFSRAYRIEERL